MQSSATSLHLVNRFVQNFSWCSVPEMTCCACVGWLLNPNSTWLVTSRLDTTRSTCLERVETSVSSRSVRQALLDTAKMHGLDTSNVSCRVET